MDFKVGVFLFAPDRVALETYERSGNSVQLGIVQGDGMKLFFCEVRVFAPENGVVDEYPKKI
jgi:hypothetical protein